MSTSLADQLRKLAIPQTSVLIDTTKRVSLLFDPSEAATHGRDLVFEIGLSGLKELCQKNSYFEEFERNLFNDEEKSIQRVVEGTEVNEVINENISKFLIRLSPYFMSRAAHKALEWLIYRYKIHEMNVKDLLALIMPYYDTNIFLKVLQLVDLNAFVHKEWAWLKSVQKSGVHLPQHVIITHAISDSSFLRFICDSTIKAIEVHSETKTEFKLQTQLAFYCSVTVGVLSRGSTNDHILTVLLPSLLIGLRSNVPDFKAASYVAVGQLVASNQLSSELIKKIMSIIIKDSSGILRKQSVFILLTIYQRQKPPPPLSRHLLKDWQWAVPILSDLSRSGVLVGPFIQAVVTACLDEILEDNSLRVEAQILCWDLLEQIQSDNSSAASIFRLLVSYYKRMTVSKSSTGDLSSSKSWIKTLIETYCAKNADLFDQIQDDTTLQKLRKRWSHEEQEEGVDKAVLSLIRKCVGANQQSVWPQLKPMLLKQIDQNKILKAWCKVCPNNENVTLLLCMDRLIQPDVNRRHIIKKLSESRFGSVNSAIQQLQSAFPETGDISLESVETYLGSKWSKLNGFPKCHEWASAITELYTSGKLSNSKRLWVVSIKALVSILPQEAAPHEINEIFDALQIAKKVSTKNQQEILTALMDYLSCKKEESNTWIDLTREHLPLLLKQKTLELLVHKVSEASKGHKEFNNFVNNSFQKTFIDNKGLTRFMSAISAGHPNQSGASTLLQIYALQWEWNQIKNANDEDINLIKKEPTQIVCHLLMSLGNDSQAVRRAAVKVVSIIAEKLEPFESHDFPFITLLKQLHLRSEEICADADQLSVSLFCLLSPNKSVQNSLESHLVSELILDRNALMTVFQSEETPLYVAAKLSSLMECVNSVDIMKNLVSFVSRALHQDVDSRARNQILATFWQRLDESTSTILSEPSVWKLAVESVGHDKGEGSCPAVSFLKALKKDVVASLEQNKQVKLLELLAATRARSENPSVSSSVANVCRKTIIDGIVVIPLLKKMMTSLPKELNVVASTSLESESWRHGIALLELMQNKKNMKNTRDLINPLFAVLKFCLDQEEQTPFEYAKQLVLGCILEFCEELRIDNKDIAEDVLLDVELIVRCLRASSNPQTHHHALLLLSCLASIIPTQVMHNTMAIFTFMGSSVTRLDDEHSVQVVAKVVDAIVPVLVKKLETDESEHDSVVAEVLRIFVWTLRDVPQHRRSPLYSKLLATLEPSRSMWIFILLLCENYVVNINQGDQTSEGSMPPSLQLGMELSLSFGPETVLKTAQKLVHHIVNIPVGKMHANEEDMEVDRLIEGFFDMKKHTPKQLRHYTYTIITFLNTLLADHNLILQVRDLEKTGTKMVGKVFKDIMSALLLYIPSCSAQYESYQTKFWKAMVSQSYDILDRMVALISSETLVVAITKLLDHPSETLRRKAVDLLNVHIQNHRGVFSDDEKTALIKVLDPLLEVAVSQAASKPAEGELIQQTALLSLRLLAKVLANDDSKPFKMVLKKVCKLSKSKGHLLASAALTIADLIAHLRVQAVGELPNFFPALLKALNKYTLAESTDIVVMSLTAALFRIIDVLAAFLSPYMGEILNNVSCLAGRWPDAADLNKKLGQIRQKLASTVPHRVLIPCVSRTCSTLIESKQVAAIGPLLSILADSFTTAADVSKLAPELTPFFIKVLQLRSDVEDGSVDLSDADVDLIEGFTVDTLLPYVLKLSEQSFKPIYYQIFHWAAEHSHRAITFYRISSRLAEKLKGLFVLFAGHFLQNAAKLLDATNAIKTEKPYYGEGSRNEKKSIMLLESILQTLHTVFLFDSSNFLSKDKFEVLLHPLIDQLENTLGGIETLEERTTRLLTPCIAQMTLATDDTQWKALNYQLLMKTRSTSPSVRIAALNTIVEVAGKLRDDYLTLLPETVGSLAELLEDEDERVELAMRDALRRMEEVLGQPIRDYFH